MTPVELVLSKLSDAKPNGRGWLARCLAHDDRDPSLSIAEGDDGRALLHCHAGCSAEAIVKALGLTMRDLMPADSADVDSTRRNARPRGVASTSTASTPAKNYPTELEAMAELKRQHGKPSAWWTYRDGHGEPVGVVVRWDRHDGGKDIRPVSRRGSGWIIGGMAEPRPLYHLPEIAESKQVYICEGEKAADAVQAVGLIATTSPHGSNSAEKADWIPLTGKGCVILPDAGDAGERYADDVTALLAKLSPPPTIKRVDLPGLADGEDAVEWIAARRAAGLDDHAIRAELERMADDAELIELLQPAPLVATYNPFPVDALPEPVRSFVAQGAKAIGCDPSYIALPMLSALASAVGNARRIRLKRTWTEPAIIWTAIVGESGTLKTPAFKLVMKPIRDRQDVALKRHGEAMADYEDDLLRYDKALAAWKRHKVSDDPPEKPQPPQAERSIVSDATVEALAPILLANPRGVLLARDELSGWIGSFDRYAGGKGGADASFWLSAHNGESILVDRKTGKFQTIYVPSASVSLCGGVQPGILDRVLGSEYRESGLLARLLLTMPPRRSKRWTEADIAASLEDAISAIFDRLYELQPDGDDEDPRPRLVGLTPKGRRAWIEFYDAHAQEQAELTGDLSAAWSKLEGYAARIALVVHLVRQAADDPTLADVDAVDETSIAAGVALSRWFGHEARRVYAVLGETEEEGNDRQLVEWIERRGGRVTVRDLTHGLNKYRGRAEAARADLDRLATAGFGSWTCPPPGPKGGRPSAIFVLNNADPITKTPTDDTANGGFGCGDGGDAPTELSHDDATPEAPDGDAPHVQGDATPGDDDDRREG